MKKFLLVVIILFFISCGSLVDEAQKENEPSISTSSSMTTTTLPPKNINIKNAFDNCGLENIATTYSYYKEENVLSISGSSPSSLLSETEDTYNLCIYRYLNFPGYLVTRLSSNLPLTDIEKVFLDGFEISWYSNNYGGYTIGISDNLSYESRSKIRKEACSYEVGMYEYRNNYFLSASNDGLEDLYDLDDFGVSRDAERIAIANENIQIFLNTLGELNKKLDSQRFIVGYPEFTMMIDYLNALSIDMVMLQTFVNMRIDGDYSIYDANPELEIDTREIYFNNRNKYFYAFDKYIDSC